MLKASYSILVVDDDPQIILLIRRTLELAGHRVITASSGLAALVLLHDEHPDVVVLDVMMPGIDGFQVCRKIRETSTVPIIMLTAKVQEEDKVLGLDAGADDYLTKPFGAAELLARVRSVLRRSNPIEKRAEQVFQCRALEIDFSRHMVRVNDQDIKLSQKEYNLLSHLAFNAGRTLTYDYLLEKVWGQEYRDAISLLQVNICRLRRKIEPRGVNPYIVTKSGVGYTLVTSESMPMKGAPPL